MQAPQYRRAERLADNAVHVVGVALGIAGALRLATLMQHLNSFAEQLAMAVYSIGLVTMLAVSAAYNMWPPTPLKSWLRRFDHSAIYVMIAGSYTPFIVQVPDGWTAFALLSVVWGVALIGLIFNLAAPSHLERLSIVLYLALGWSGLAAYHDLGSVLDGATWILLAAGGLIYSAGVAFHLSESLPFHNAIWHVFVLGGALTHYAAVLGLVPSPASG